MQQLDISTITDEKELKAIAFDLKMQKEHFEQQLNLVMNRLQVVQQEKQNKMIAEMQAKAQKSAPKTKTVKPKK